MSGRWCPPFFFCFLFEVWLIIVVLHVITVYVVFVKYPINKKKFIHWISWFVAFVITLSRMAAVMLAISAWMLHFRSSRVLGMVDINTGFQKCPLKTAIDALELWAVAPSWWNQMSSKSNSSSQSFPTCSLTHQSLLSLWSHFLQKTRDQ